MLASAGTSNFLAGPATAAAAAPTYRTIAATDIPALPAAIISSGTVATARLGSGGASSTTALFGDQSYKSVVTSVGLAGDGGIFNSTVTGSPVTTSGAMSLTYVSAGASNFWAGPTTGAAGAPAYRTLAATDIPALPATIITSGAFPALNAASLTNLTPTSQSPLSVRQVFFTNGPQASASGTGIQTLFTNLVPASTLGANGNSLVYEACGTNNNGGGHTLNVQVFWGTTSVLTAANSSSTSKPWRLKLVVQRVSQTLSYLYAEYIYNGITVAAPNVISDTQDMTTQLGIGLTVNDGTSSAGDMTAWFAKCLYYP